MLGDAYILVHQTGLADATIAKDNDLPRECERGSVSSLRGIRFVHYLEKHLLS